MRVPWLALIETYLVQRLLRSPRFHEGVRHVHKNVHKLRHGTPIEEMGGTKLDKPDGPGFVSHFLDEVRLQLGRPPAAKSSSTSIQAPRNQPKAKEGADHNDQQPGYLSHLVDALREQSRGNGNNYKP